VKDREAYIVMRHHDLLQADDAADRGHVVTVVDSYSRHFVSFKRRFDSSGWLAVVAAE